MGPFSDFGQAMKEFDKKFKDKSGYKWEDRNEEPKSGESTQPGDLFLMSTTPMELTKILTYARRHVKDCTLKDCSEASNDCKGFSPYVVAD